MKCVFVAIGWENIALQALSAVLKKHSHEVELVYDQALFDDKNYLSIEWMAKILDQKDLVLQRILELDADLLCFHVQTVQYKEMYELAKEVKKYSSVPILFGGIHPHSSPETVLLKDDPVVDMICLSEGEYPLLELCDSIEAGRIDYTIHNLWFRLAGGEIIKNPTRPLIEDISTLPTIDKELFAPHFPMKYSYLSCPTRGCPYTCTFCSLSFLAQEAQRLKGKRVRQLPVDTLIKELKQHIKIYKSPYIDFRQPVMSADEKWTIEFFTRYKDEIALPFRCFMNPQLITYKVAKVMREAGCFAIQMGVECWDQEIRQKVLRRRETNEEILKAAEILESVGQKYAFDYILGLPRLPKVLGNGDKVAPSEEEKMVSMKEELMSFSRFITPLKNLYRVAPFMIQYMPGTDIIEHGINAGDLDANEVIRLNDGDHGNYMSGGSVSINKERLRLLNGYRAMLRLMSILPPFGRSVLIKFHFYKVFWMAPFVFFISFLDLIIAARDRDARTYVKNYIWWFGKRFDKNYHLYMFKRRKKFKKIEGTIFELPIDGLLYKLNIFTSKEKNLKVHDANL